MTDIMEKKNRMCRGQESGGITNLKPDVVILTTK